jgi:hypothetical protein
MLLLLKLLLSLLLLLCCCCCCCCCFRCCLEGTDRRLLQANRSQSLFTKRANKLILPLCAAMGAADLCRANEAVLLLLLRACAAESS